MSDIVESLGQHLPTYEDTFFQDGENPLSLVKSSLVLAILVFVILVLEYLYLVFVGVSQ